jgi:FKBP-type peptidyl-prolyl cis-trans isomerase 2
MASVPFIEIDFTARSDGAVFDTTRIEVAQAEGLEGKGRFKPLISPLAPGYLLEGLYDFLKDKKEGSYSVEIAPEKAFGKKDPRKTKLLGLGKFREHDMNPYPGMEVEVDNARGVVRSVSSGRVLVDFNHPVAGRTVTYDIELNRFVTDPGECFKALLHLILSVPEEIVSTEQDGKKLVVTITLTKQVPDAMFAEIANIGSELIGGIDDIVVEQKISDPSASDAPAQPSA